VSFPEHERGDPGIFNYVDVQNRGLVVKVRNDCTFSRYVGDDLVIEPPSVPN
jgi:hypothetical protein